MASGSAAGCSTAPVTSSPTRWSRPGRPTPTAASRRRRTRAGRASYPGFRGYARAQTITGEYEVFTLKPGRVPDGEGGLQAPHIDVSLFARGMLDRVVTRIYFADEAEANAEDAVLRGAVGRAARATLIAEPTDDGYRLDVYLQGDRETVFFAV